MFSPALPAWICPIKSLPIAKHWKEQGFHFDAIYTGYLASPAQCGQILDFFQEFRDSSPSSS